MACAGHFAGSKLVTGASGGQASHLLACNGDASAPRASCYRKTSFANSSKGNNSDSTCQLRWSAATRRSFSSGSILWKSANGSAYNGTDVEGQRSKLEALLYCGKSIPEEKIDKPTGVPAEALPIGNKPQCLSCEAKGAVECPTCTGTGLYVDAVLESQGVIVRVKCLGCGGSGSTMCPKCGGRGHV